MSQLKQRKSPLETYPSRCRLNMESLVEAEPELGRLAESERSMTTCWRCCCWRAAAAAAATSKLDEADFWLVPAAFDW